MKTRLFLLQLMAAQERVPYNCAVTIIDAKEGQAKIIDKDRIYYDESLCFDHYKVVSDNVKS